MKRREFTLFAAIGILAILPQATQAIPADVVKPAVEDKVEFAFEPADFRETTYDDGWIHDRMQINVEKRLLQLKLDTILEPFVHRPGAQWWIGEHVGKYLHAASYAWLFTGDARLKKRMDHAVRKLIDTQLPNGYLGTYAEKDQFYQGDGVDWRGPIWDVWTHSYNLIGLLTYYQATGEESALKASRRAAGLLYNTFVVEKKSLRRASAHVGMAATSVLEPMAVLYRLTGEHHYLDFCHFVIESWDQKDNPETPAREDGSRLLSSLLEHGNVYKTANRKAYEMLANLLGLMELYRVDPDERYLTACKNAWNDIVTKRLYITGTTSYDEMFAADHTMRPGRETGEGCVTVTWLQLNTHLLELTGEVKYADELERTMYNALLAAQSPLTGQVSYYTPLIGYKGYGEASHDPSMPGISCCSSSVPRGIAMIPEFSSGTLNGKPALLQYIQGKHALHYGQGANRKEVDLHVRGDYPESGNIEIEVNPEKTMRFPLVLRVPVWAQGFEATVAGDSYSPSGNRLLEIDRKWSPGDKIQVTIPLEIREVPDSDKTSNMVAFVRGPQVLATDDAIDAAGGIPESGWWGDTMYTCIVKQWDWTKQFHLVPFADVGQTKADYAVLHYGIEGLEGAPAIADLSDAISKFAPGWVVKNCLDDGDPGIHAEVRGRKNVLVTHPLSEAFGCVLSRQMEIPEGKTTLRLVVGHNEAGDWTLIVKANNEELLHSTVGPKTAKDGWMKVDVDLSRYAGQEIKLELVNKASDWHDEAGYWAKIKIVTD